MLDAPMRKIIDPPLNYAGRRIAGIGVSANEITVSGFVVGMAAVPLLAFEHYLGALAVILANRLFDGLDGATARSAGPTDFGGYLDIVCDFIFYSAVIFGFALARPAENGLAAAFLILSFVGTGTSFLAYAILAAKRGRASEQRGHSHKAFYYLGGLTEGTETIAFIVAMTLLPDSFVVLAVVFGALAWLTTGSRVVMAWRSFRLSA